MRRTDVSEGSRSHRLIREDGASAVEYGLLVALVAAAITAAVIALGLLTGETFSDTCTEFRTGVNATGNQMSTSC